ncbi:hypothetical protein Tco_0009490 [Tanacetum coccineum]
MVAFLKKLEGSSGFHQIVDFLNSTHIKYALTENPTIYVSLIHQFWQTASASTSENGEMEITATIDGRVKTVTEAFIMRHLKLEDSDGISTEIFEQLALMGYVSIYDRLIFSKGTLFSLVEGAGSTVLVESHHTPTDAPLTSSPHISPTLRSPIRQETKVSQPSSLPHTNVADEAASTGVDFRHGGAATTVTSLDVGQGSSNINKTPAMPHDSPLPRGHTLGSDEARMQQNELIDLVIKLEDCQARRRSRVVISDDEEDLEDSSKQGRMIEEIDQDAGVTLVTPTHSQEDQPEDQLGVFSAAKVLADAAKNVHTYTRRKKAVSIGSGGVSTASRLFSTAEESVSTSGASMPVSTAGTVQEVNKDKVVKLQEQLDKEERQRISRVHEEASSLNIEEWEDIQATIEADKELAQMIQAEEREKYSKQLKRLSFDELKTLFETTIRRVQTFHPIESEGDKTVPELTTGSSKRDAEVELDHEGSKKQKTNEASGSVQEQPEEEEIKLTQEDLQQMMMVVPVEEVYVEAL